MHEPFFYESGEDKDLVIFIHGFMGSPRQFSSLAQSVHSCGFAVASLLLPGHGGAMRDFSSATMGQWLEHVISEVGRLSGRYERIYLVGHSMGCLLAINAAVAYPTKVRGLLLIACPFRPRITSLCSLTRQMLCRKSHPIKAAYLESSSIPVRPDIALHSIKPTLELRRLMRITKDELSDVRVPVTAIYSARDEVVTISSLDVLKKGLIHTTTRSIVLTESRHAYYPEYEQGIIERALRDLCGVMQHK